MLCPPLFVSVLRPPLVLVLCPPLVLVMCPPLLVCLLMFVVSLAIAAAAPKACQPR